MANITLYPSTKLEMAPTANRHRMGAMVDMRLVYRDAVKCAALSVSSADKFAQDYFRNEARAYRLDQLTYLF